MKKRNFLSIALAGLMLSTVLANLTACQEPAPGGTNIDFEDLVPEAYGEWDGNYIYRGNVKSKTTGDDAQYLVQSVELGGVSYQVLYCNDYDVAENTLYLTLSLSDADYSNCLVAYDVSAQEQTLIFHKFRNEMPAMTGYYEYELNHVEQILENGDILVNGMRRWYSVDGTSAPDGAETKSLLFVIDKFGTVVEEVEDDYQLYTRISKDYWQKYDYVDGAQKLYARAWRGEPVLVYEVASIPNHSQSITFVEQNGAVGYFIETWRDKKEDEWYDRFVKLEFFDLKQNKLTTLFESDVERYAEWVAVPERTCLYLYNNEDYTYTTKDGENTYTAHKDIVVLTFEYSDKGVKTSVNEGKWSDGKTYKIEAYDELTGDAYARVSWATSASGCDSGGYKDEYWEIPVENDSNKRVLKKDKYDETLENIKNAYYRKDGVSFGGYVYFVRYQRLRNTIIGQARSAYIFQRYTNSTDKTDTMQLWMNGSYTEENEKYSSMLWDNNGDVLGDFIISKL